MDEMFAAMDKLKGTGVTPLALGGQGWQEGMIVATILQVTGIWNDYLFGLIFAGKDNHPMTVQLNNLVNTTFGERRYHIDMAATILTSMVPLLVYFFSGRWFVRGIAAGAVKG